MTEQRLLDNMKIDRDLKVDENPWWSHTRLSIIEDCKKKYWFQYILHADSKVPSSAAIGKHNHKIIEKMWLEDSYGNLKPGYKSYESCINISLRDWKFNYVKRGKSDGKEIEWGKYDGNGWGKRLLGRIAETAGLCYTRFLSEEPRLKSEIEMKVEFEGLKISARVDELRRPLVIRDHKSGTESIGEYFVRNNLQLTLNAIALFESLQKPHTVAYDIYPEFRGVNLNEFLDALTLEINDVYPRIENGEHRTNTIIYSTKRTEHDFNEAIQAIQSSIESLERRDFHPTKANCDFCVFNKICSDYTPPKYHDEEYRKEFPLFANSGIIMNRFKPTFKKRNYQGRLKLK